MASPYPRERATVPGRTPFPGGGDGSTWFHAPKERPLGGYTLLLTAFGVAALGIGSVSAHRDEELEEHEPLSWKDLALLALATQRVSRTIAKDRVTTPLRAPFVRFERDAGSGELVEQRRGRGLRRALGQLITCPFCVGTWVAASFVAGIVVAPRHTRAIVRIFAINAVSNWLQRFYGRLTG